MKVAGTTWKMIGIDLIMDLGDKKGFHSIEDFANANDGEAEEWLEMGKVLLSFTENGEMQSIAPLPAGASKEEIEEAVKSGELTLLPDGQMLVESKSYSQETDDAVTIDSGMESDNPDDLAMFNTATFDEAGHLRIFMLLGYAVYEQVN